jgi:hypothetical protein
MRLSRESHEWMFIEAQLREHAFEAVVFCHAGNCNGAPLMARDLA